MVYRLLIVVATIIWGSSFVIVKDVTGFLTTGWILVVRFSVAAVLMVLTLIINLAAKLVGKRLRKK